MIHRVRRLWKVIVLGMAASVATMVWSAQIHGVDLPFQMILALLIPTLHVLRFPTVWPETVLISLILALCLGLAAMNEPDLTAGAILGRITALILMAALVFFVLVAPFWMALTLGPKWSMRLHGQARSNLDRDALRASMTFFPGNRCEKFICGEADAEGKFAVTVNLPKVDSVEYDIPQDAVIPTFSDHAPTPKPDPIPATAELTAIVHSTGPDHYEVFTFLDDGDISASRCTFQDFGDQGCAVEIIENSGALCWGEHFGFWLTGFMKDYLTDEIDRAEGRAPRSNRSQDQRQIVIDLANLILPWLGGQRIEET